MVFALSSLLFAYIETKNQNIKQIFRSHMYVSFITTISYVIMALALATLVTQSGEFIFWTRWLFYMGSCSILTVDIAHYFSKSSIKKAEIATLTSLTMFCGFLASITLNNDRWLFFVLSTAAYVGMLVTLFTKANENKKSNNSIMWYILITWSLFPIVWILAPTGLDIIRTLEEAILYLVLDLITKIAFGLYITKLKK
jgi:sensory rhodopsin